MTDLAGALLANRTEPDRLAGHVRAFELASRALEIDVRHADGCQARAVALETMSLEARAAAQWKRCLELDLNAESRSGISARIATLELGFETRDWPVAESRLRQAALAGDRATVRAITAQHPQEVRRLIEEDLHPTWVEHWSAGRRDEAARDLKQLELLSRAVLQETGDSLAVDSCRTIKKLVEAGDSGRLEALVRGHRALRAGILALREKRLDDAGSSLEQAATSLAAAGSPFEYVARYRGSIQSYLASRFEEAENELATLRYRTSQADYRRLLGVILRMQALNLARQSKLSASLARGDEAIRILESVRDVDQLAEAHEIQAQVRDLLGEFPEGWTHRRFALFGSSKASLPETRYRVLIWNAQAALEQGFPRAALEFEDLGGRAACRGKDRTVCIAGMARQAEILGELNLLDMATELLNTAQDRIADLPPEGRVRSRAHLEVTRGKVLLRERPEAASRSFDQAIVYYEDGDQIHLADLYPLRGRAFLDAGNHDRAEADFRSGIDYFERHRADVLERASRISYADTASRVYDAMIRFQYGYLQRPRVALGYAEQSRARLLLERAAATSRANAPSTVPSTLAPLLPEQIVDRTPPGAALVYYALLNDRLVTWVSTNGSLRHFESRVDPEAISQQIETLRKMLEAGWDSQDFLPLSHALFELLIRPIQGHVQDSQTLILLPDKALHQLPFAALMDSATGRFLAQDHPLAVSPSATFLLRAAESSSRDDTQRALIVGNPRFDPGVFRGLRSLAGAEAEAGAIRELYDSSTLLMRKRATSQSFLQEMNRHSVVHFAGHALPSKDPLLSRLVLAPDPATGDTGELFARDLYEIGDSPSRLVVLAACSTATGRVSSSEGALSLVRPFLAIGVPSVVASLWQIHDAASAQFFTRFHTAYRETDDPVAALHQTQVAMIEADDDLLSHPRVWAAIQLFVGAQGEPQEIEHAG